MASDSREKPSARGVVTVVRRLACVLGVMVSTVTAAQDARRLAFEVASVRPSSDSSPSSQRVLPTRADLTGVQLRALVLKAFGLQTFELAGPDWLVQTRYDIRATYPPGATEQQFPEMLRTLLIERFGMVSHVEPRRMTARELVVSKDGIKMREVAPVDDLATRFTPDPSLKGTNYDRTWDTLDGPMRLMMIPLGTRTVTNQILYDTWTTANRTFVVDAKRIDMREFARVLGDNLDQPVIDRTGLAGLYEFKAELGVNQSAVRILLQAGVTSTVKGTPFNEPSGVSTLKAVESLGLKLEERRTPIDVLVIDRIERTPLEN